MKYLFGPVNSRRLGVSLRVDLVPHKTCTMNCLYCECGATTVITADTGEYVPTAEVLSELDRFLAPGPALDVITFSGSGEPTLHSGMGAIIGHLKDNYPGYRVAVLTNGSLLWKPEVRGALARADVVIPSLDAVSEKVFRAVNRPARGIDAERFIRGLEDFAAAYAGELHVEVFIIPGMNDAGDEIALIRDVCLRVKPRTVQLNTLDRPGTEPGIRPASGEELARIRDLLFPLQVTVIGWPMKGRHGGPGSRDMILSTLRRRPSTMEDLASTLGLEEREIREIVDDLCARKLVATEDGPRGIFYRLGDADGGRA